MPVYRAYVLDAMSGVRPSSGRTRSIVLAMTRPLNSRINLWVAMA